jgi:pimeloyl-ACP methyl ester carboxylesterase
VLEKVTTPGRTLLRAAARPETYVAQVREAASLAVTAAIWPFGWLDRGLAELRTRAAADRSPVPTPVLLIHGYGANKSNWFFIERELRSAGFERLHGVNYNPLTTTIPDIADTVVDRARALMAHFDVDRVHLIGHSTGGLVARWAVQVGGLEECGACVTIASPHQGSPAARLGLGTTARQLRPGSDVVQRLRASSRRLPTRFVAFYSNVDVLSPGNRSTITEPVLHAANVLVKDEGHLSLMLSRRVAMAVAAQLAAAEGLPGYGAGLAGLPAEAEPAPTAPLAAPGAAAR